MNYYKLLPLVGLFQLDTTLQAEIAATPNPLDFPGQGPVGPTPGGPGGIPLIPIVPPVIVNPPPVLPPGYVVDQPPFPRPPV